MHGHGHISEYVFDTATNFGLSAVVLLSSGTSPSLIFLCRRRFVSSFGLAFPVMPIVLGYVDYVCESISASWLFGGDTLDDP